MAVKRINSLILLALMSTVSLQAPAAIPFGNSASQLCHKLLQKLPTSNNRSVKQQKVSENSRIILDKIVGRVQFYQSEGKHVVGHYISDLGVAAHRHMGAGDIIINSLSSHRDDNSPTALRVEEKAVVPEARLQEFLSSTQSKAFADQFNSGELLKWQVRDQAPSGFKFATLTEYGSALSFNSTTNRSTFVVKPRYRKYFQLPESGATSVNDYQAVMGDLVALELKITSLSGPNDGSFLSTENTVFKPRIFVNDAIADKLKSLPSNLTEALVALEEAKNLALGLVNSRGQLRNPADKVHSFFQALAELLQKDINFLRPAFAVKYERDSFSAKTENGEYQFTADRNVSIFSALPGLASSEMQTYFEKKELFKSREGELFVELKSPVREKLSYSSIYTQLNSEMQKRHILSYKKGSGKYSIARFVDRDLQDAHMDKTIFENGTFYWLIKGTGNLDSVPKKSNILIPGNIEVAYPFTTETGSIFRIVFKYRPDTKNGETSSVLDQIKILNERGFDVPMETGFKKMIQSLKTETGDNISGIEVEGSVIPFKTTLNPEETDEYLSFFKSFYYKYSPDLRNLAKPVYKIKSNLDLQLYKLKLKGANIYGFLKDRGLKGVGSLLIISGSVWALNYYTFSEAEVAQVQAPVATQQAPILYDLKAKATVSGLILPDYGSVQLIAEQDASGTIVFSLPSDSPLQLKANAVIVLKDEQGELIYFRAVQQGQRLVLKLLQS